MKRREIWSNMNPTTFDQLIHGQFIPSKEFFLEARDKVFDLSINLFSFFSHPKKTKAFANKVLNYEPIDYLKVTVCRIINKSSEIIFKKNCFNPSSLTTRLQRERREKINEKINRYGENSPICVFSKTTSKLVYRLIPRMITKISYENLSFLEMQILYKSGICFRYFNYKMNQHTNYRENLIHSKASEIFKKYYFSLFNHLNCLLLQESNVNPIFDFELIFLNLCEKLDQNSKADGYMTMKDVVIKSIAGSLKLASQCEEVINDSKYANYLEDEKMIKRISWYKKNGALPRGICDPYGLDTSNLAAEMEKGLLKYIEELSYDILDKNQITKNRSLFIQFFYWLEGKDFIAQILKFVISELGVKQIIDPHLFTLSILSALGNEIADFELDGFGKNKLNSIYFAGKEMLINKLNHEPSSKVISILKNYSLKANKKGLHGIHQKKEAQNDLSNTIENLIYNTIKEDKKYCHEGIIKGAKKIMKPVPIVGTATTCLHFAVNSLSFSYNYFMDQKKESFFEYMGRNLAGQDLSKYIKDKVLGLIYHPCIKFIVLQLIEDVHAHMLNKKRMDAEVQNGLNIENLKTINFFILDHFMKGFPSGINLGVNYFASDAMLNLFKEFLKPSNKSFSTTLFEAMIPKLKETLLCWKLCDQLKKDRIIFDDDEKFWELYIRHYLNQVVDIEIDKGNIKKNIDEKIQIRERLIDDLLKLSEKELMKKLQEELDIGFYEIKNEETKCAEVKKEKISLPLEIAGHNVIVDYEPNS